MWGKAFLAFLAHMSVPKGKDKSTWAALSAAERKAASVLGYDGPSWDKGLTPLACQQWWEELANEPVPLAAALALGYTEREWMKSSKRSFALRASLQMP